MPVTQVSTPRHANARSFAFEGQTRVFRAGENPDDPGRADGYLFIASGPMASAYVSAASGGNSMILRPHEMVMRQ